MVAIAASVAVYGHYSPNRYMSVTSMHAELTPHNYSYTTYQVSHRGSRHSADSPTAEKERGEQLAAALKALGRDISRNCLYF